MVEKSKIFIQTEIQIIRILESKKYFKNVIFGYNPANPNTNLLEPNGLRFYNKFWKVNSENIQYVCLDGITNLNLIFQALFKLPNLKTLEFRNCKNFEDVIFDKPGKLNISSLLMGDDPQFEYMEEGEMSWILSVIPKLERLQITSTKMDRSILRYLRNAESTASLKYLNLEFLNKELRDQNVRKFLFKLIRIKHLDLEYFRFEFLPHPIGFESFEIDEIVTFLTTQINLKTLKLNIPGISMSYEKLLNHLPKLKSLRIDGKINNYNISSVQSLKPFWKLKGLEISFNSCTIELSIFDSLDEPSQLKHLHIFFTDRARNRAFDDLLSRMHFLPILSCLRFDSCKFSNTLLQSICQNLLLLKELRLHGQWINVSGDYGLTGIDYTVSENEQIGYSISRLTVLEILSIESIGTTEVTDLSLQHLAELKHLRKMSLNLNNTQVCVFKIYM